MKWKLSTMALLAAGAIALGTDKPIDLTGCDAKVFREHVGKVIVLRGRLEQGMQGLSLFGGAPTNVAFYIIPEARPGTGYTYPAMWERCVHRRVRLTGTLRLRATPKSKKDPLSQDPNTYYYMVLQDTRLERSE